jgi:small subunit ribosomal protein S21
MPSVKPNKHPKTNNVEPFDRMLRRFKKSCERAGIVQEVRQREFFEKPASKRNQKNQDIKRRKKLQAKRESVKGYRRR